MLHDIIYIAMLNMDFSHFNFLPLIVFIVLGIILVFVIEKIGGSAISKPSGGGGGGGHGGKDAADNIMQFVANSASNAAQKRRQQEASQRALVRQIKIAGLIAGFAFIFALTSLFSIIGALGDKSENGFSAILFPAAGLIMGTVITIAFSIRFFQLKRTYELYYGSLFGKK